MGEPDFEAIKQRQQEMWSAGDFAMVATTTVILGEQLCEAVDVLPGERVLDVACGSGNTTLAAARRAWGNTIGVDYVPELLERARARAAAERLEIEFVEGDAEQLPFENASFDDVRPEPGAGGGGAPARLPLRRSHRDGELDAGRSARAARAGALGAPEHGREQPGRRRHVLFGDGISSLTIAKRQFTFRYRSTDHYLEFFRTSFGPVKLAFERLDEAGREALTADTRNVLERFNRAGGRALVFPGEYVEVVATRA
jgi:SAM-dependent methyltransferase